jgi:hypothetical protein
MAVKKFRTYLPKIGCAGFLISFLLENKRLKNSHEKDTLPLPEGKAQFHRES